MITDMEGIFVPVVTPFSGTEEAVDLGMLRHNMERLNTTGVRGYMPLGSNGEFFMMTDEECCRIVDTVKKTSSDEKLIFAGSGRESERLTVEFTKRVSSLGVDAVFVLTPHYFPSQMNQECLRRFYEHVADRSPVPVLLYQAPAYAAGVSLTADTVTSLARHPNIIGMKGTGAETAEHYLREIDETCGFTILSGTFGSFCQNVRDGAGGGVLSCANYVPELCCELYRLLKMVDPGADALYEEMASLLKKTTAPLGVGGVKMAMNLLGYQGGMTRKPLGYPEERQIREMKILFEKGGLTCR